MAACCEIGAISVTENTETQLIMREFGENIGIAFQIQDDIFDYTSKSRTIGKPVGNDLKEKKLTLPLIYAFTKAPRKKSREIINIIRDNKLTKKDINSIIDFAIEYKGIEYAREKAGEYSNNAIKLLAQFEDSPAKNALINFSNFVINRKL
jgi:octaprenyl-diphosphate synthase